MIMIYKKTMFSLIKLHHLKLVSGSSHKKERERKVRRKKFYYLNRSRRQQYEDELEEFMHSALQRPRLRALVSDFPHDASVSGQCLSETDMSETSSSTASSAAERD